MKIQETYNPLRDHGEHGPVGPTAFWKISDGCKPPNTSDFLSESSDEDYTIEEEDEEVEEDEVEEDDWVQTSGHTNMQDAARAAILSILGAEAVEQLTENDPRARELILGILGRRVGGNSAGGAGGEGSGSGSGGGEGSGSGHEHVE